jgi:hypothetical protein
VIKNCSDPVWSPMDITLGRLCMGDVAAAIRVEIYDWCDIYIYIYSG